MQLVNQINFTLISKYVFINYFLLQFYFWRSKQWFIHYKYLHDIVCGSDLGLHIKDISTINYYDNYARQGGCDKAIMVKSWFYYY